MDMIDMILFAALAAYDVALLFFCLHNFFGHRAVDAKSRDEAQNSHLRCDTW